MQYMLDRASSSEKTFQLSTAEHGYGEDAFTPRSTKYILPTF